MTDPTREVADSLYQFLLARIPNAKEISPIFTIWERDDRLIASINPKIVLTGRVIDLTLGRQLQAFLGHRVVVSDPQKTGLYIQISREKYIPSQIVGRSLEMSTQPSPVHVPIGVTKKESLWLSIIEMDAVLIGGSRGMGKSTLLHAWIQALANGGKCELFLWDGKNGSEFDRYESYPRIHTSHDLRTVLSSLEAAASANHNALAGFTSVYEYNRPRDESSHLPYLILIIDEAAIIPLECQTYVSSAISQGRAFGIYPVLATQRPGVAEVQSLVKANLSTRISFPVPSSHDSMVILGFSGAEKLPKVPGRLLISWHARHIQAQAFSVDIPSIDSMTPMGPDLVLIQKIWDTPDRKVTVEILQGLGLTYWQSSQRLKVWREKGWIVKDSAKKNASFLRDDLLEK